MFFFIFRNIEKKSLVNTERKKKQFNNDEIDLLIIERRKKEFFEGFLEYSK